MLDLFRRWHFQAIGQAKLELTNHMSSKSNFFLVMYMYALFFLRKRGNTQDIHGKINLDIYFGLVPKCSRRIGVIFTKRILNIVMSSSQ